MQNKTVSFIESLYCQEDRGFRFHPKGNVTLLSTCFAVQSLYLIDKVHIVDTAKISEAIIQQQRYDGLFVDKNFSSEQLSGLQSIEYIEWQFTFFSLIALDMLGISSKTGLHFLEPFQEYKYLEQWLDTRNWTDFWYCSNEIMFLLYFLIKSRNDGDDTVDISINRIIEYLNARQDEKTGYWGEKVQLNPLNGMFGAAHIYLFYHYLGKKIQYPDQIVLSTLALQLDDGLYGPAGGGACEDYDGVEILIRLLNRCPELKPNIEKSLLHTLKTLIGGIDRTGGFSYRLKKNAVPSVLKRIINQTLGRTKYRYSGWNLMECDKYSPDIWGTYFRLMTVAHIETTLGLPRTFPYNSYSLPGWGYLHDEAQSESEGNRAPMWR